MDKKIILSTNRFANAPGVDYYQGIELKRSSVQLNDETVIEDINLSDLFNEEREESFKYRLLGKIEYLSILNNLKINYTKISDLFVRYVKDIPTKNIFNSFKVYMVYKSDTYIDLGNNIYKQRYEIITELDEFQLYNCGFSQNIFHEQKYLYNFNIDLDIRDKIDYFNKPITDVFLYFDYQLDITKNETLIKKDFNQLSDENNNLTITENTNTIYNINDLIVGNLLLKEDNNFDEDIINEQEYKIRLVVGDNEVFFKYKPFIRINLREYNDTVYFGNLNSNTKNMVNIPEYAKIVGNPNNNNVIWKEILPHGFIDPITNIGVNHPFINGTHYVYTNNILAIQPDLSNFNTSIIFNDIKLQGFLSDLFILNNPGEKQC